MLKQTARRVFAQGCEKVSPNILKEIIRIQESTLLIREKGRTHTFPLCVRSKIYVVAFGKASIGMTKAVEDSLGDRYTNGVVIAPESLFIAPIKSQTFLAGRNNLPDENSVSSTKKVLTFLKQIDSPEAYVLFLISGGGSALLCSPNHVSLSEKLEVIKVMVKHGASIQELNTVRQYLSEVKGGKLLSYLPKSKVISLILSDIVGDPVDLIASGPTVISVKPKDDPLRLLHSLSINLTELPPKAVEQLRMFETMKQSVAKDVSNFIVINNDLILEELRESLEDEGFQSHIVSNKLCGDASSRGVEFAQLIATNPECFPEILADLHGYRLLPGFSKLALIYGGETTVILRGSGRGGRNQEMVLSCLHYLKKHSSSIHYSFAFMSVGTDGQDGPNDAAGAIITEDDLELANLRQCETSLNSSDSYNFWKTFNGSRSHVITGLTGTNVMDVQVLLLSLKRDQDRIFIS